MSMTENWYDKESDDSTIKNEEEESNDLPLMLRLEGKVLKILTPNKLLTRFLVLLAQIKASNHSNKLNQTNFVSFAST